MLRKKFNEYFPAIDKSSYLDFTAVIIGKVKIGRNVFVGPGVVIRADEPGSLITIEDNCNVQDRVIIHALEDSSVLIKKNCSLAHGCIIHGPCKIDKNCFIGFGSVVFNTKIGEGVVIKHLAVVDGVDVSSERVVGSGGVINRQEKAKELKTVDMALKNFTQNVVKVNLD